MHTRPRHPISTGPCPRRQYDVFNSRNLVQRTFKGEGGLAAVSRAALANARDLAPIIRRVRPHDFHNPLWSLPPHRARRPPSPAVQ
jgi:hypothetical protein